MPDKDALDDLLNADDGTVEQLSDDSEEIGIVPVYNRDDKGRFGTGNNLGKLKKGNHTKTTTEMKKFLLQFVTDTADDLYDVWNTLSPKEKASLFLHIVKYIMPTDSQVADDQSITIVMKPAEKKTYPE